MKAVAFTSKSNPRIPEQNGVPFEIGETLYEGDTAIKFELIHFYLSQIALGDEVKEPCYSSPYTRKNNGILAERAI